MYRNPFYPPRLFPWIYHPIYSPFPPEPTTPTELFANVVAMRNARPAIPPNRIMNYHERWPWLQSERSFSALVELAIRHSSVGMARKLVQAAISSGLGMSEKMEALVTRLKVRLGHRTLVKLRKARVPPVKGSVHLKELPGDVIARYTQEIAKEQLQGIRDPSLRVLAEFLGTPQRKNPRDFRIAYLYIYRREMRSLYRDPPEENQQERVVLPILSCPGPLIKETSPPSLYESLQREYLRLEGLPLKDFTPRTPPLPPTLLSRLVSNIPQNCDPVQFSALHFPLIRRLLLLGQRSSALEYAFTCVKNACHTREHIPFQLAKQILRIVHLLIHRKYGCPSYAVGFETLKAFLHLHCEIKPTSETLCILLQTLGKARRKAQPAFDALNWFLDRWPEEEIENEAVRRTIAKYGIQERTDKGRELALEMASREARFGTRWRDDQIRLVDLSARARPFSEVYTRSWRDKMKWIKMGLITRSKGFVLKSPSISVPGVGGDGGQD